MTGASLKKKDGTDLILRINNLPPPDASAIHLFLVANTPPPPSTMARYTSREIPCSKLFSQPWEIMWMILEQLPSYSCVALALTAKPLFTGLYPTCRVPILGYYPGRAIFPLPTQSELSERDELLLLLERDNPALGVCFDCRLLWTLESGRGHLSCAQPTMVKWRCGEDTTARLSSRGQIGGLLRAKCLSTLQHGCPRSTGLLSTLPRRVSSWIGIFTASRMVCH